MKTFNFNDEQWRWLCTIVKYRVDDETKEKNFASFHSKDGAEKNQMRIDMWQSIYDELTKEEVPPLVR
jgi:hypothetical protein